MMGMRIGRRQMLVINPPAAGTVTALNTITPCAACKLLRRRCAEECPFSPYFSPHEPHKFAAIHKIFGASNVSKMLLDVPETQRADAANSLVYEANVRLRDPVYGCMGAISALQQQIQSLQAELNAIRAEILRYKYREAASSDIIASTLMTAIAISSATLPTINAPPATPPPAPPPPPPPPSIVISSFVFDVIFFFGSFCTLCLRSHRDIALVPFLTTTYHTLSNIRSSARLTRSN